MINKHQACPRALDPGVSKHFDLDITDTAFSFARKTAEIAAEAATDGVYVVRTSLPAAGLRRCGDGAQLQIPGLVERAFRCIKTVDLQVRPVYHWLADRVRAHVFLCMLAYYLEWHMRQRLAPMLFDDTDKEAAEALRASVVAQAQRSPAAVRKQTTGLTEDGLPVHSFRDAAGRSGDRWRATPSSPRLRPTIRSPSSPGQPPIQQKAFQLLGVSCSQ